VAETITKMICPDCHVEMNHHSDKLVYYPTESQHPGGTGPSLGGIIEEFHTCPKCGGCSSRLPRQS
jgi:hypothetical protein